jgi:cyclic pyranopterin phosphate synthase
MKKLSHFDEQGRIKMVDVSEKATSARRAVASARVLLSKETIEILRSNENPKGNPQPKPPRRPASKWKR